ncbi:hypothetical protein MNEG_3459 [Monoraphidium neglectum]|uniref:EGF-like domain-containing protein n=1 Tax=Monoraphidium neglectum TaxID=145388 RepID=A0A0D2K1N1_9CHLO|nr:hypothetical protein MNEG_3459 [Monoraphidium neglectum]KIZ04498.1 hypothetical protein MNEG_3459 [Monoraphidium neglectum]|eukprot:XP_013903517.1 hypothetical protein MNEG_3459 [Monoraphidium neglectum]
MGLRWSLLLLAAAVALLSGDASAQVVVPQCYSTRNLPGETNPCKHSFDAKFDFTNTTVTVPGGKKNPAGTSYSRFCITLSTTRPCNPADSMCCPAAVPVTSSSPSVYELQLFTRSECVEKGAGNTELKKIRFYLGDKKISPGIDKKAPALTFRRSWWGTNKLCFEIPLDGQGVTPCSSLPLLCSADGCKLTLVTKPFDQAGAGCAARGVGRARRIGAGPGSAFERLACPGPPGLTDGKTGPKKKTGCKMSSGLEYDCTATCTRPGFKCNAANLCIPYVPPPTTGDDCSNGPADICKVQCLNGGTCLPPDSCDCTGTGYSGPTCNIRNCTGFAVNAGADQTVTTGTVNITVAVTPAAFTPADISFTFTPATAGAACVAAAGAPGVYTCSGLPNGKTTINVTATKDVCVTSDTVDITVTPSGGGCTDVAVSVVPAAANVVNGAIDVTITLGASLTGATPVVTVTPSGTCAVKAGNVYTCTGLATGQSTISASATLGDCKGSGSVVVSTSTGEQKEQPALVTCDFGHKCV